ncbi:MULTISPECIES: hypothetical protein [unclassified Leifsonia]|uniref:hypothetical protein n=1 Tax=unclassified Leifsonia TaxID=2663824 RepID=UPI001442AA1E|nr:hypothetical protein [Leifsonia sp. PS1209]QIZ98120.1 hypothetical protein HF024_06040 [Leifsonia sp. PS1209]
MSKRDRQPADYSVPKTGRLRRRLFWRLRRMRAAVDVETLEVFEHELAAFERGGVAEIERQRTRNLAACAARVTASQKREELIRGSIERTEHQLKRAEVAAERLDARLLGHDPDLHNYA